MKCNILCKFAEEKLHMEGTLTPDKIQKFSELIAKAEKIAIVTHTRPDGDAIGSSIATACFIRERYGKEAGVVVADAYSDTLDFILDDTDRKYFFQHDTHPAEAERWIAESDLVICQDCNGFDRTDGLKDSLKASEAPKVLIDHHLNPQEDSFVLCFSEVRISSASELVYWILMEMPDVDGCTSRIPMHALCAIMAGMTTDMNNFANSVFPSTLQMASELLECGVDRDSIVQKIFNSYRVNRMQAISYLLSQRLVLKGGLAYIVIYKEDLERFELEEGELEGLVNMPLTTAGIVMSITLKEDSDHFRVSIRSKKKNFYFLFSQSYIFAVNFYGIFI